MTPRISIIVPVYNVENILKYCVESLIVQSFSDIEILLVDDGSSDNSPKLCDEYLSRDSRIKVFHKSNGGLSDARNFGIEHAIGENFLFIDSDDVLHKDFCKVLIELQDKYNAEITSTDLVKFYDVSELHQLSQASYSPVTYVYNKIEILEEYFHPHDKTKIYHGLCMKLYRKELFENLRFEKGRLHEDLYITYKLLDKCNTFVFIDLPYYYYYQKNLGSITKNYREKNLVDEFDAVQLIEEYFIERNEIKDTLYLFLIRHYNYLLTRTYEIPFTEIVHLKRKEIQKNLLRCLSKTKKVSKMAKLKFKLRAKYYRLYSIAATIKGAIKNAK
ncbi:MAG: glycosyltransferase family 2 protein [Treponema sp.]|nr:glycosyltransferase family 2 protein [Treponema sp.]